MDKTLDNSIKDIKDYLKGDRSKVTIDSIHVNKTPNFSSKEIKALRHKLSVTQSGLAYILNISPRTVEAWEANNSKPNGSSRRLLQIIQNYPEVIKMFE